MAALQNLPFPLRCTLFPVFSLMLFAGSAVSPLKGQTVPAVSTIAEIDTLRGPYLRSLTMLQAARDARCEPVRRSYLSALEHLEKENAARPELDPNQTVKAERERFAAKMEPKAEDRKAMIPALSALRVRYDADSQRIAAPLLQQEQQLTRQYVNSLDSLQRRLIAANQIQKAALVRPERDSAALLLPSETKEKEPAGKTPAVSTVRTQGKLDPAVVGQIAAAVASKGYARTEDSIGNGEKQGGADMPDAGGLLVGFEFFEVGANNGARIRSLRPYFLTSEGIVPGKDRGKMEKVTSKILARPGYAVAGLLTMEAKGLQIVFMKIDPVTGAFDPAPANSYKSLWVGSKSRGTPPKQVGGDGHFIIGVYGKTGADCDSIGLIEKN